MSACQVARVVDVRLRAKRPAQAGAPRGGLFSLVVPYHWTRGQLLRAVRAAHPDETVRIVTWARPAATGFARHWALGFDLHRLRAYEERCAENGCGCGVCEELGGRWEETT